ncbi:nitroreductase/quinone reductase family protein [Saccharothrix obliqua]|uniref:nitroreductase/quinone reductase family protein n=1 Tax=Saccharothrix obliqua TaxID=2861747 RepID=UPI0027E2546A|nr:nitroreductase/quinone reductase family protein [Saccharothrix obliqua]
MNQAVIEEFRANGGVVGGAFAGTPLLLLTTAGARSGRPRTTPLVYRQDGDRLLVFASNGGDDRHPAWFRNLTADPQVTVEVGERVTAARAEVLTGADRDAAYAAQITANPAFGAYQEATDRVIPVVALHPVRLDAERLRGLAAQLKRHHAELRAELLDLRPGRDLMSHCLAFCGHLRLHHVREDGAFTAVEEAFPDLAPVIARLRAEHRVLAGIIAEVERTGDTTGLAERLDAHFAFEEEHLTRL